MRRNGSWGYQKSDSGKGATKKQERPPDSGDKQDQLRTLAMSGESLNSWILVHTRWASSSHRPTHQALINMEPANYFQLRPDLPFICLRCCCLPASKSTVFSRHVLCAKHLGGQLVLERSVRNGVFYLYLSSFWSIATQMPVDQLSLKISPRYNGKTASTQSPSSF